MALLILRQNSGSLWSCNRGVGPPLLLRGEIVFPFELQQESWASIRVVVGNSGFLSSFGGKLGVPLKLQEGSQASSRVARGKSVFHLCCSRGVSPLELRGLTGFLLSYSRGVRPPLELQQATQGSSQDAAGNSVFLLSCNRAVRPPLKLWQGT